MSWFNKQLPLMIASRQETTLKLFFFHFQRERTKESCDKTGMTRNVIGNIGLQHQYQHPSPPITQINAPLGRQFFKKPTQSSEHCP